MPRVKRKVRMSVLRGQPTDGSGKVCIHLVVRDEKGPFTEPHVLHPVYKDGAPVKQKLEAKPTRCRLACNPHKLVGPVTNSGVVIVTPRSDDPRAVTCLKCIESQDYKRMMESLN